MKREILSDKVELYNGNCLEIIDDLKGKNVVIVTDPPFNIGYKYKTYKDKMKNEEYLKMLGSIFKNSPFVVIHYPEKIYEIALYLGITPERVISWVYNSNTARQHRDIAYFGVTPDMKKVRQPYKNLNDKRIQERIKRGCTGAKLYDWWQVNQVKNVSKEKTAHPCQMPLEVMEKVIGILPDNTIIVDPFMGSGTTGVASVRGGYKFIGIELDEEYFSIAKERIYKEI